MSERAELERRLIEAADEHKSTWTRSYQTHNNLIGAALALADAIRDERENDHA